MANKTLAVKVDAEVKGADKVRGLGSSLATVGVNAAKLAAGVGAGVAAVGAFTSGFASDLNESLSKVNVVFGDSSDAIVKWSETSATALGISQQQALESAGTFGNLFDAMGVTEGASADMSTELVQLASDLASFNNIDPTEALEKLRAGLVGEAEPLRTLGVNISAAATEQKALELGLISTGEELSAADKAMANYAIIMEQTTNAQGDFARTSDGMANQQRTLAATFQDTMADVGQAFVPIIESILPVLIQGLKSFGDWVSTNSPAIQGTLQGVVGAIGVGFGFLVNTAIPALVAAFEWLGANVLPAITGAFEWIVTNVVPGLVAAFQSVVAFWVEQGPTISSIVGQVFGAIVSAIEFAAPIIGAIATVAFPAIATAAGVLFTAIDVAMKGIGGVVEVAGTIITGVVEAVIAVWEGLVGFFGGVVRDFRGIGDRLFRPIGDGFDAAIGVVKGIWNAFVRFWNGIQLTIPRVDIPLVGPVGGFTIGLPDLPMLAAGGIVTKPTLAMIGEAGPEAVIPLDRAQAPTIIVNVTVQGDLRADDPASLADAVRRSLWASGAGRGFAMGG